MDKAQEPNPIADGVRPLHALDDARVFYSLRSQLEKVVVFHTDDSSHFSGAFQMNGIISSQLASDNINSLHSQLLDDLW